MTKFDTMTPEEFDEAWDMGLWDWMNEMDDEIKSGFITDQEEIRAIRNRQAAIMKAARRVTDEKTNSMKCPLCKEVDVKVPGWHFSSITVDVKVCDFCWANTGAISVEMKISSLVDSNPGKFVRQRVFDIDGGDRL